MNLNPPTLPALRFGEYIFTVDSITGHGAAEATLAVRRAERGGVASRRIPSGTVSRPALTSFALELLDLAEQMIHPGAYRESAELEATSSHPIAQRRRREATQRYFRLVDRLPVLQLAQKVVETCDDHVIKTLLLLLAHADTHGTLPVNAKLELSPVLAPTKGAAH